MKVLFYIIIEVILIPLCIFASSSRVMNARIDEVNYQKKYAYISFDVSWKNSWRSDNAGSGYKAPYNHDAVWVFIKFKGKNDQYQHATLSLMNKNHIADEKSIIEVAKDGKGVFIYSRRNFSGNADYRGIKLRWNFKSDSVEVNQDTEIKVLAIEMVYIPEGPFYVGDSSSFSSFYDTKSSSPALISEKGIFLKAKRNSFDDQSLLNKGILVSGKHGIKSPESNFENIDFPTGYNSFYIMKYEISQGEYAEFLNLILIKQALKRFPEASGKYRNTISFNGKEFIAQRPKRACNFLSWMDGAAFADWAGLRPYTEFEFEKACRGYDSFNAIPNPPVKNEFAWNDNFILSADTISGVEKDGSESVNGNAAFGGQVYKGGDGMSGPLKCGIFENKSPRSLSGKSYYGVCELSGNLSEQCVTIGNAAGRSFRGLNGDGSLDKAGDADVSYWPGINGNSDDEKDNTEYIGQVINSPGITEASGSGQRGGSWYSKKNYLMISDRSLASHPIDSRMDYSGFRCAR